VFNGGGDCRFCQICTARFAIFFQLFCILSYVQAYSTDARFVLRSWACVYLPVSRMFGTDAAFNPDLLSGRLEEILPTIQQVILLIITAVGPYDARLLAGHVNSTLGRVSEMR
jgi:hypothetical protein